MDLTCYATSDDVSYDAATQPTPAPGASPEDAGAAPEDAAAAPATPTDAVGDHPPPAPGAAPGYGASRAHQSPACTHP